MSTISSNTYQRSYPTTETIQNLESFNNINEPFFGIVQRLEDLLKKVREIPNLPEKLLAQLNSWEKDLGKDFEFSKLKGDKEAQLVAAENLGFLYFDVIFPILKLEAESQEMADLQDELQPVRHNLIAILKMVLPQEQQPKDFLLEFVKNEIQGATFLTKMQNTSEEIVKLETDILAGIEKLFQDIHTNAKDNTTNYLLEWEPKAKQEADNLQEGLNKILTNTEKMQKLLDEGEAIKEDLKQQQAQEQAIASKLSNLIKKEII